MADLTGILDGIRAGDSSAAERLLPLVYDELRRLAAARLRREQPGQTLQATALVNEAYLRIVGPDAKHWDGRGHFFAAAAEAMRRILIDRARKKRSRKHGGNLHRVDLDAACTVAQDDAPIDLLALDEALCRLEAESPARAQIVKLRFFAGLSMRETAEAAGVSLATAERHWTYARTWLYAQLSDEDRAESSSNRPG